MSAINFNDLLNWDENAQVGQMAKTQRLLPVGPITIYFEPVSKPLVFFRWQDEFPVNHLFEYHGKTNSAAWMGKPPGSALLKQIEGRKIGDSFALIYRFECLAFGTHNEFDFLVYDCADFNELGFME